MGIDQPERTARRRELTAGSEGPDRRAAKQMTAPDCTPRQGHECSDTGQYLSEICERLEAIDWAEVPGFTAPEAAALTARLAEAREGVGR